VASEAEVDLVISTAGALPELAQDLRVIVSRAENGAPQIDIDAGLDVVAATRELSIDLQRAISDAEERGDAINVSASLERAQTLDTLSTELESILGSVQRSGASSLEVNAILDRAGSIRRLQDELADAVRVVDATAPDIELDVDVDTERLREFQVELRNTERDAATLGGTFRSVLGAAAPFAIGIAGIGAAAGTAAPLLAGLTAAALEIAPAAGVAVSGLLTLKLATTALQVAMIGVSEAIETAFDPEASPEDLAKAMERLAPNAKAFVTELRGMRSALSEIQQSVQDNVFANFDVALQSLSTTVLPQVSTALERAGTSLNQMALGAVRGALVLSESGALGQALNSSTRALQNLETVPGSIVTGLGAIAAAAGPSLERLTKAASSAADRISEQLLRSFASGELEKTIDRAVDTVAQLGRSIGNVFSGLGNVFDGLTQNGAGLFDTLEKITQAFEDATASKGFQDALGAVSSLMGTVVNTVLPLFSTALKALGPIFTALGPPLEKLVETLGGALGQVLEALGPVLVTVAEAIGKLIPVLSPVITLFGTLLSAILPALTPLFEAFGRVFEAVAPFVTALAEAIGGFLAPILESLGPLFEALLAPMVTLYETAFPVLTEVVERLSPTFTRLGEVFGELVEAAAPVIQKVLEAAFALAEELAPVIEPLIELLLDLTEGALKGLAIFLEEFVVPAIEVVAKLFEGDFVGAVTQAKEIVRDFQLRALEFVTGLRDRAVELFNDLSLKVVQAIQDMAAGVGRWILELVNDAVATFRELPGEIEAAVGDLGTLLFSAGANVVNGLIAGLKSQLGSLISAAQSIADTVANTIDGALEIFSPSKRTERSGKNTVAGFVKGINESLGSVKEAAEAMVSPLDILGKDGPASAIRPVATGFDRVTGRGTNVVNVYIGNQLLNQFINDAMRTTLDQRDRTIATGVRI
jgi:phage-related protein